MFYAVEKITALARATGTREGQADPFCAAAQEARIHYYGDKLDDINVVVTYITTCKDVPIRDGITISVADIRGDKMCGLANSERILFYPINILLGVKKYEIEVSKQKVFRAKQMAEHKVHGDHIAQYTYVLELKERIPDTTVKIDVERDYEPDSMTRQFKRIYACLGALKSGFKAGNLYQAVGPKGDQCVVNVEERACSCKKWDLTGIPESWVYLSYWLATWEEMYRFKINPCNGPDLWPRSDSPITYTLPEYHKPAGRPSKKRKKSAAKLFDELVKNGKLSRFGQTITCCKCGKKRSQ
nr:hypothetical protein [Tanacetum cinerariifolium]